MSEDEDKPCCNNCTWWYGIKHDLLLVRHLPDNNPVRNYGFCIRIWEYISENDTGVANCSDYVKEEW